MEQDICRKYCSLLAVGKLPNAYFFKFKGYKSVHHHTFQINQPTRCNDISSLLLDVYLQLNMFRASSRSSSGAQQLQLQFLVYLRSVVIAVLLVVVGPTGRPTTTYSIAIATLQR
jgi:hypothetical protein